MIALAVVAAFIGGAVTWDAVLHWLHHDIDVATTLPEPSPRIDVRS